MRGQPHVRGSSTNGRNQNLIPGNRRIKATSAVEWRLRRPRGKGRRRWNKKRGQEKRAHNPQRQRSAEENSFRSNQGVVFFLFLLISTSTLDFPFLDLIFVASNSVRNTLSEKIVRMYDAYVRGCVSALPCFPWLLLFPLLCSLAASGQEEAGRASECTVPVSSWNLTRLFLIRFRSPDPRVGSWFGRHSGWARFIRRAAAMNWNSSSSSCCC